MLCINLVALFFSKPMGAICCIIFAVIFMMGADIFIYFRDSKILTRGFLLFIGITVLFVAYEMKFNVIMRIIDTIEGSDASNSYRVKIAYQTLFKSFMDYNGIGCGFGNINTASFKNKYGLSGTIVNSFGYFIIETGIFGIVFLMILLSVLGLSCIKQRNILKYGLFVFLCSYQIFGSHFTNGLIWWVYGYIIANKTLKKKEILKGKYREEETCNYIGE